MSSRLLDIVARSARTVALTGAGVSAESGVPTFRGAGGLWKGFRAEELATPRAMERDPSRVWEWYAWRREVIAGCEPNAAHRALAGLEETLGDSFHLVTQNVDGLHRRAGSRAMTELHGCLWRVRCTRDGTTTEDLRVPLPELPPRCGCGALLRPDVVWFGEALDEEDLSRAFEVTRSAELFLSIGTSAVVHPAAALPALAHEAGAYLIEVNPEETPISAIAHERHRGPAAEVLPRLLGLAEGGA